MRLDERAADPSIISIQLRKDKRAALLDADARLTVDLVHDPEQGHQLRSISKSGGRAGILSARDGLQRGHGSPAPLHPSWPIGLSGMFLAGPMGVLAARAGHDVRPGGFYLDCTQI